MSRRSLTLLIASVGTAVAIAVSVLVPVPYVILGPGPTLNTLGKDSSGHPLITISGHASYPATGHLNLVTVSYQGCAGNRFNIFTALVASAAGVVLYALVGGVIGQPNLVTTRLPLIAVTVGLMNAALSPVALRLVRWALHAAGPGAAYR